MKFSICISFVKLTLKDVINYSIDMNYCLSIGFSILVYDNLNL